jgi:glycosyltransferase involved in cell wall biosynthesis
VLTVAYLANQFPSAVEPYVGEEIEELRRRGVRVIAGSVRKRSEVEGATSPNTCVPEIVLQPLQVIVLLKALLLCLRKRKQISPLIWPVVFRGREGPLQRIKALLHMWLGACYAVRLQGRGIEHIHAHHGYFGSWVAMAAARLLDLGYSLTLHGSDLLLRAAYLDVKLAHCTFCLTVSEYNRRYILDRYPGVDPEKVVVSRLGVEVSERDDLPSPSHPTQASAFTLVAVGRLCAVKNHAFLVRACAQLRTRGVHFECCIAGDGPERRRLQRLIRKCGLEERFTLLGHVPREQMNSLYDRADVVVLTSRSEGIPLVLMEAMARGKIVLAPSITGIPELVIQGKNGFLYEAGSLDDFVNRLLFIRSLMQAQDGPDLHPSILSAARQLDWLRHAARVQVRQNFNRKKNLQSLADLFLSRIAAQSKSFPHENSVLQQIQLSLQRHRGVPVRTDGVDALAGPRGGAVCDV